VKQRANGKNTHGNGDFDQFCVLEQHSKNEIVCFGALTQISSQRWGMLSQWATGRLFCALSNIFNPRSVYTTVAIQSHMDFRRVFVLRKWLDPIYNCIYLVHLWLDWWKHFLITDVNSAILVAYASAYW